MIRSNTTIPRPRPVHQLWWCALAIAVAFVGLSAARSRLSREPGGVFSVASLRPSQQSDDSWWPMNEAFDYLAEPHATPVYTEIFLGRHVKFQYPLTALLPLYIVRNRAVLNTISAILILLTCAVMFVLFARFLPASGAGGWRGMMGEGEPLIDRAARFVLPVVMTLTFYPMLYAYRLGQLQVWLAAGFALLVLLWIDRRFMIAGILAGLLACAKPQFGLLLIWAATRKRWSFCAAFVITGLLALAAALSLYGFRNNLDYLPVLSLLSRHGETFYANQSVNGFLNRLLLNGDASDWRKYYLPPFSRVVYVGTLVSSLILIAGAIFVPARHRGGVADLMLAGFTCTVASPVAWTHHYSVLLPVFAALFAWSLIDRPLGKWTLPATCASYLLIGTYLGGFWNFSKTRLNVVQSYPLAGVLIALALLYVWVVRGEPVGSDGPHAKELMDSGDARESLSRPHPLSL